MRVVVAAEVDRAHDRVLGVVSVQQRPEGRLQCAWGESVVAVGIGIAVDRTGQALRKFGRYCACVVDCLRVRLAWLDSREQHVETQAERYGGAACDRDRSESLRSADE